MTMRRVTRLLALIASIAPAPALAVEAWSEASIVVEIEGTRYRIAVEEYGFGTMRLPGGVRDAPLHGTRSLVIRKPADDITAVLERAMKHGTTMTVRFTRRDDDGRIQGWILQGVRIHGLSFDGTRNDITFIFSRIEPLAAG